MTDKNEKGYNFEQDKSLTDYAHEESQQWGGGNLKALTDYYVLRAYKNGELKKFLLCKNGNVIDEAGGMEAMAALIDMYKLA
jgi:hypothetical protein